MIGLYNNVPNMFCLKFLLCLHQLLAAGSFVFVAVHDPSGLQRCQASLGLSHSSFCCHSHSSAVPMHTPAAMSSIVQVRHAAFCASLLFFPPPCERAVCAAFDDLLPRKARFDELTLPAYVLVCVAGAVLHTVQTSRIFNDSKTFVDMPTSKPVEQVMRAFAQLGSNPSRSEIRAFVDQNFLEPGKVSLQCYNGCEGVLHGPCL